MSFGGRRNVCFSESNFGIPGIEFPWICPQTKMALCHKFLQTSATAVFDDLPWFGQGHHKCICAALEKDLLVALDIVVKGRGGTFEFL